MLITKLKNLESIIQYINLDILINEMLQNIGSTDPELRDTLIYNSFGKLILEDHLTTGQMYHIHEVCLNNLFIHIGQNEGDSVFTRSFSTLTLALVLKKDKETRFLSDEILTQTFQDSIEYLEQEADIRGYVEHKGWAHSIAHGADLLAECISHPNFDMKLSSNVLDVVKLCLFKDSQANLPYVDDEEERLIFAVEALQKKGVTESEIEDWLLNISDDLNELLNSEGYSSDFFRIKNNVTTFLSAYYFRLLFKNKSIELQVQIAKILEVWYRRMYE